MTRIFTDGAEMGDMLFWDVPSNGTNESTAPRSGSRHYRSGSFGAPIKKVIAPLAELYYRSGIYSVLFTTANYFLEWHKGSTVLGGIRLNQATDRLEAYTSTGTLVATGSVSLLINTWYLLEVHVKISATVGVIAVRIDGITDINFSGDTKPGADTTIDVLAVMHDTTQYIYLDDLALNDTAGVVDNSWCGDGKIVMLRPNAAGDVAQLAPSAGANWQCVDETPPNTTDYVSSATAGQYDLYNCDSHTLATSEVVRRVQVEARVLEESALGDSIQLGVKTESTEYFGASQAVITSYQRYVGNDLTTNPNTGAAWTQAELDAIQVGVKVI